MTVHTSNTFNETILETKLQFYILRMSMHDWNHALKVDETSSIGASSLAAIQLQRLACSGNFERYLGSQLFSIASYGVGVVVDR